MRRVDKLCPVRFICISERFRFAGRDLPGNFGRGHLNDIKTAAIESDSARFSRALRSAILWPAGVIIFTAILMLVMIFILLRVVKWSEHSYAVIAETRSAENEMVDMQSGVRGYLLTGDHNFPSGFSARRDRIDLEFKKLALLVRDNPAQSNRVQNLILAKNNWFDYAKTIISQRTEGAASNPAWMKLGDGIMSNLRDQFQDFTQVEEDLHDQRIAHVQNAKKALGFAGGGLALGVGPYRRPTRPATVHGPGHRL